MNELLLRTSAPSLVLVIETEAVTRLVSTAHGPADERRLEAWLASTEARTQAAAWALCDRDWSGGADRQRAWAETLAAEPGIVQQVEALLQELTAAEARAGEHPAGVMERVIDRLRSWRASMVRE